MRKHRMFVLGASLLALSLFAAACGDSGGDGTGRRRHRHGGAEPKGEIVVGVSGAFPENQLVAEMYAQVLEANGCTVTVSSTSPTERSANEALESRRDRPQARVHGLRPPLLRQEGPHERDRSMRSPRR